MTKINKLGKSTFVIAILSFVLVAVLAFGGTYAYFSATTKADSASITMGHLRISENTKFDDSTIQVTDIAVPGQPIITADKGKVTVEVDSNINYFIRAHLSYEVKLTTAGCTLHGDEEAQNPCTCADKEEELLVIDTTKSTIIDPEDTGSTGKWIAGMTAQEASDANAAAQGDAYKSYVGEIEANGTGWYYYSSVWAPKTTPATAGVTENVRTHTFNIDASINPDVGKKSSQHFMDAVVTVTVYFEVIQADYILNGATATGAYTAQQLQEAWAKADLTETSPIPAA